MPVEKYRRIEDMPPLPRVTGPDLARRIRALWKRSRLFAPARPIRRGVHRYRTLESAKYDFGRDR